MKLNVKGEHRVKKEHMTLQNRTEIFQKYVNFMDVIYNRENAPFINECMNAAETVSLLLQYLAEIVSIESLESFQHYKLHFVLSMNLKVINRKYR